MRQCRKIAFLAVAVAIKAVLLEAYQFDVEQEWLLNKKILINEELNDLINE